MNSDTLGCCPSVFVENRSSKPGDQIWLFTRCSIVPGARCPIADVQSLSLATSSISFCSLCKTRRLAEGLNFDRSLHCRRRVAQAKESLNLIDTTLLALLKAIAKSVSYRFVCFNLLMGAFYFPLQLFHFEVPIEEPPADMDSGFFVTEELVEALVTPKEPRRPSAPSGLRIVDVQMQNVKLPKKVLFNNNLGKSLNWKK